MAVGRDEGDVFACEEFSLLDGRDTEAFYREVVLLHRLRHPLVVPLHATFYNVEGRRAAFIQTWLLGGGDLEAWMAAHPPPMRDTTACCGIAAGFFSALAHCHAKGVAHGGIAAANVFLTARARAVLGGFGRALEVGKDHGAEGLNDSGGAGKSRRGSLHGRGGGGASGGGPEPSCAGDMFAARLLIERLFKGFAGAILLFAVAGTHTVVSLAVPCLRIEQRRLFASLLSKVKKLDPEARLTAGRAGFHPFFAALPADSAGCLTCYERFKAADGLHCNGNRGGGGSHFLCSACLSAYVVAKSNPEGVEALSASAGALSCPGEGCGAAAWAAQQLLRCLALRPAAFAAYEAARYGGVEQRTVRHLEERFEAQLKRAQEELLQRGAKVQAAHVVENILTLKCPACGQAFVDFDGCFAIRCSRCSTDVCAYCPYNCRRDAHGRVHACPQTTAPGRDVYGSIESFERTQRQRRQR
ncbi:unnamed protein product, partial [Phaeothamnion confervicola]